MPLGAVDVEFGPTLEVDVTACPALSGEWTGMWQLSSPRQTAVCLPICGSPKPLIYAGYLAVQRPHGDSCSTAKLRRNRPFQFRNRAFARRQYRYRRPGGFSLVDR